jgi:transposase-like protein
MGLSGVSKSQSSKLCNDIDERVNAFSIDREWPYLGSMPSTSKCRDGGRIVSVAAIIAVEVMTEGRRGIVGLSMGHSKASRPGRLSEGLGQTWPQRCRGSSQASLNG